MPADSTFEDRAELGSLQTPPKQGEAFPCPRCNSTSTKFCYYNNYNLSQPRHFCKGCRRYWTHGGTLRNIPVGGGSRKNSKRSRSSNTRTSTSPSSSTTTTTSNSNVSTSTHEQEPLPVTTSQVSPLVKLESGDHQLREKNESFSAMLNAYGHGFVDPYVYGSGFGFFEMGVGYGGRGVWTYPGLSYVGGVGNCEGLGTGGSGCDAWQFSDVGEGLNVLGDSDVFAWPSLAISAPGKSLK